MLTCVTRSMNNKLYDMMISLCPAEWKFVKVLNSSAFDYLDYIFTAKFETKWVLNLDEDCFLIDYRRIYDLIRFMENNDYDYCGVQDGGSIPVRIHNPLVSNPFFNLFNIEIISKLEKNYYNKKYPVEEIKQKYSDRIRYLHTEYKYDDFEPFYNEFFWLLEQGLNPYFNNATEFVQEKYLVIAPLFITIPYFNCPTMINDHENREIAIHTWHSRYINYPNIKKAIHNCYDYCFKNSNIEKINKNHNIEIIDLKKLKRTTDK
ncbi:MAG: hypothetical protein HW421_3169 [Ignavibacteria bacterium]|nr:hypothetical protein [Ignavibacteria bacterium]